MQDSAAYWGTFTRSFMTTLASTVSISRWLRGDLSNGAAV